MRQAMLECVADKVLASDLLTAMGGLAIMRNRADS